jgi:hypothetical protein
MPEGRIPNKSVAVHLAGLYSDLERALRPGLIAPLQEQLASVTAEWPHYPPLRVRVPPTIFEVAMAETPASHLSVRQWAEFVWALWDQYQAHIAELVELDRSITQR